LVSLYWLCAVSKRANAKILKIKGAEAPFFTDPVQFSWLQQTLLQNLKSIQSNTEDGTTNR
jgi:hypothetical protein